MVPNNTYPGAELNLFFFISFALVLIVVWYTVIMHWSLVQNQHGASNSCSKGVAATTDWGGQRMCKIQSVNSAATNKSQHQNFEKKEVKERKKKERKKERKREKETEKTEIIRMQIMYFLTPYRLYHGVLYYQNVIKFHGTGGRVLRFTPERKLRHSLRRVSRDSQMFIGILFRSLHRISIEQHNIRQS